MLRNEMYIGTMVQGKYGSVSYKTKQNRPRPKETWYRKENTHEAIIDQELWNTVQRMLEEKAKPFATGKTGIFAGKVKCAGCGYHTVSYTHLYLAVPQPYLKATGRQVWY